MATLDELVAGKHLIELDGGLDGNELPQRFLYAFPHALKWLDQTLPALEAELGDGKLSPIEQVDVLFHDFVSDEDFSYYERSHSMLPTNLGVWEMKTTDVRLFGWFPRKATFIIAECDTAFRCKNHNLYPGYRSSVVRRRNILDLDEPKFLTGEYDDVL
ncbi:MAG: hypothetical protein E5X53_28270 [Mesorhizobium sp.]|uniref:hypothetical protein n=1 Tax=Mesorhizobium sp. TaxID=1871066 RepID=UPI0011FECFC5|nr:hypothetical protein [Mesorhizobium sp.]TIP70341.1 MAG: hypothetical protein E5X55_27880 [Mesorhizobium sp.]TIR48621.1 MAG: hypothetical protein E5X53_28270 [Mesorhizobium sp.]TJV94690.1 MAG: hypothetical protein E5X52_27865 [Mesorhizobium sp.]